MQRASIIFGICLSTALVFGIVLTQITARISPDYFHFHITQLNTQSVTILAMGAGLFGSVFIGIAIGLLTAITSTVGSKPRQHADNLLTPILLVVLATIAGAVIFGLLGAGLGKNVGVLDEIAEKVPEENHHRFIIVTFIHLGARAFGFFAGLSLVIYTFVSRSKLKEPVDEEQEFLQRMAELQGVKEPDTKPDAAEQGQNRPENPNETGA